MGRGKTLTGWGKFERWVMKKFPSPKTRCNRFKFPTAAHPVGLGNKRDSFITFLKRGCEFKHTSTTPKNKTNTSPLQTFPRRRFRHQSLLVCRHRFHYPGERPHKDHEEWWGAPRLWVLQGLQQQVRVQCQTFTLGARGPGNQQKHLEYIAGSG